MCDLPRPGIRLNPLLESLLPKQTAEDDTIDQNAARVVAEPTVRMPRYLRLVLLLPPLMLAGLEALHPHRNPQCRPCGIGTGLAMRIARDLSAPAGGGPDRCQGLAGPGATLRTQHPRNSWLGDRSRGLALAAKRQRAPRRVWIVLGMAALLLLGGHPFPAGTFAFGLLFLAALLAEGNSHRQPP